MSEEEQQALPQEGEDGQFRAHLRHGRADAAPEALERLRARSDHGRGGRDPRLPSSRPIPRFAPISCEQARQARDCGVLWSVAGRPRRAIWEPDGELWFTDCCNHAVQASAADVLLDAMARVDRALPGTLVASVHDELVLEVTGDQAEHAAGVLAEHLTAAFARWFPEAPTNGLVSVKIVKKWSDAK